MAGKAGVGDCTFPKSLPLPTVSSSGFVVPLPPPGSFVEMLADRSFPRSGTTPGTGAWSAGSGETVMSNDELLVTLCGLTGELSGVGQTCVEAGDFALAGWQDSSCFSLCCDVSDEARGLKRASRPCSVTG